MYIEIEVKNETQSILKHYSSSKILSTSKININNTVKFNSSIAN